MIGKRLAKLRKERGWNQQELAERLSIAHSTISAYERNVNEPEDKMKIRIAKLFNISLDYLIGTTDVKLTLEREDGIDLPQGFPPRLRGEVYDYIGYLMYKEEGGTKE